MWHVAIDSLLSFLYRSSCTILSLTHTHTVRLGLPPPYFLLRYDTNGRMFETAIGAAGIALAAAGLVVLLSSRSFMLTFFSIFTIGYVLTSTTAMLVASGWSLGFLESVCFAILIGVSCDFVIHFGHAYAACEGNTDRHERTYMALIRMGPSILAAAFTTVCAAAIMLFTVVTFFRRFATILFYTIIQATVGSFIVYLTLSDTIGPSQPTYIFDWVRDKIRGGNTKHKALVEDDSDYTSSDKEYLVEKPRSIRIKDFEIEIEA